MKEGREEDYIFPDDLPRIGCSRCKDEAGLDFEIRMAFQPIVDAETRSVYAYEALVRGADGETADEVLGRVGAAGLYRFDQTCRVVAIATAARLGMRERLSINFLPKAVYEPAACIRLTLEAARQAGILPSQLIFEFSEKEPVRHPAHTLKIVRHYRSRQIMTAFDDFGAGYSNLTLLAQFQPDIVKLDMELIRGIGSDTVRQRIVEAIVRMCQSLGVKVVAEGIETIDEFRCVRSLGVSLLQGYFVARPALEALPELDPQMWDES